MSVVHINYEGCNETLKYQNVTCDEVVYESGDFIKDWYDLMKDYLKESKYEHIVCSSSVDHFFFDGANYDSAYLTLEDGIWNFKYIDIENMTILEQHLIVDSGVEYFVPNGTRMTWNEFKLAYENAL